MANLVTDMLVGLVRGIVNLIPEPVTDSFNSVVDFAYVRFLGLPFIVLGYRQTGKTTLLEWLRTNYKPRKSFEPEPTAAGGNSVRTFTARAGDERMRVKARRDVGGEYSMWETDWVDLLRDAKPRGIIFMIDGDNPIAHKDALNFTLQMMEEEVVSIKNLKTFMVLVNKSDLWSEERTLEEVLDDYRNETRRLNHQAQRLGFEVLLHSTSLKSGEGVREAVEEFFKRVRPRRKRTRAAAK
jgi:hypothetical protein